MAGPYPLVLATIMPSFPDGAHTSLRIRLEVDLEGGRLGAIFGGDGGGVLSPESTASNSPSIASLDMALADGST